MTELVKFHWWLGIGGLKDQRASGKPFIFRCVQGATKARRAYAKENGVVFCDGPFKTKKAAFNRALPL